MVRRTIACLDKGLTKPVGCLWPHPDQAGAESGDHQWANTGGKVDPCISSELIKGPLEIGFDFGAVARETVRSAITIVITIALRIAISIAKCCLLHFALVQCHVAASPKTGTKLRLKQE